MTEPTPGGPRSIDLVLTAGCNLTCSYCYQNEKQPGRHADWSVVRRGLDLALTSNRREVAIGFYGGEPLMRFETIRRAIDYVERRRRPDLSVRYGMITNGTLLDADRAALLAAHRVRTQISFDGVPEAQAERGRGTFGVLDRLLVRLRRDLPEYFRDCVEVSITLTPWTVRHLADSIAYFVDRGVGRIRISPLITDSSVWKVERIAELEREFERVLEIGLRHFDRTGEVPIDLFRKRGRESSCERPSTGRARTMCGAPGGDALAVDVDGQAYGCLMFAGSYQTFAGDFQRRQLEPLRLGEVRPASLPRAVERYRERARGSAVFRHAERKRSSYGECRDCRFLDDCSVCPVSIGNAPGNDDADRIPDFLCAYNLVSQQARERFPAQPDFLDLSAGRFRVPGLMRDILRVTRAVDVGRRTSR